MQHMEDYFMKGHRPIVVHSHHILVAHELQFAPAQLEPGAHSYGGCNNYTVRQET